MDRYISGESQAHVRDDRLKAVLAGTAEPEYGVFEKARVSLKKLRRKVLHSRLFAALRRRKVSTGSVRHQRADSEPHPRAVLSSRVPPLSSHGAHVLRSMFKFDAQVGCPVRAGRARGRGHWE